MLRSLSFEKKIPTSSNLRNEEFLQQSTTILKKKRHCTTYTIYTRRNSHAKFSVGMSTLITDTILKFTLKINALKTQFSSGSIGRPISLKGEPKRILLEKNLYNPADLAGLPRINFYRIDLDKQILFL